MSKKKEERKIDRENSSEEQEELKVAFEETFCFPDYGIAIKATSREEAEKKLLDYLRKK